LWNSNNSFSFCWKTPVGNTTATEEYDGTSWTAGGSLTTARSQINGLVELKQQL
jgi:hypothetical protein